MADTQRKLALCVFSNYRRTEILWETISVYKRARKGLQTVLTDFAVKKSGFRQILYSGKRLKYLGVCTVHEYLC